LTVADELADTNGKLRRLEEDLAALQDARVASVERTEATQAAVAAALNSAAERIEQVTKVLNPSRTGGVTLG
jgi:cell division protein ZapA